ncbi:vWA domain-containing protein [Indiicoccus explosivorum]|uniref:vWA domain-containing protein n=1 Tax=Indiicoccus explosivorum TaxID=1917864 RepID=UPI000B43E430|nr:BatA and WFA domain-containing protein [Indiicoccus explosivorum]
MGLSDKLYLWTAVMPLAVILYYFFRKKFEERRVPSVLLWQELTKETEVSPFLRNLQRNALFYLQLAALTLLMLALTGPYIKTETPAGAEFIFIVDPSATMLAGDPALFSRHQEEMLALIERTAGKPVTIITAGHTPEVVVKEERDPGKLKQAVNSLEVTYGAEDLGQALALAETLGLAEDTSIHLFTDKAERSLLTGLEEGSLAVHASPEKPANVSVRRFGIAEAGAGSQRAAVQLINDSEEATETTVTVTGGGHEERRTVTLEEGEEQLLLFGPLPAASLWLATLQAEDHYAVDNRAAAYAGSTIQSAVVDESLHELIGKGLTSAGVQTVYRQGDQLAAEGAGFIVTDQEALLDRDVPVLLFGRNGEEKAESSGPVSSDSHALFAYSPLEDVHVAALYPPFPSFRTIARAGEAPFIQLSPNGDVVVLADLSDTDWPLHPSFPLFLWSASKQLSRTEGFMGTFLPNEQRVLSEAERAIDIFKEDEFIATHPEDEAVFTAPSEPGIYETAGGMQTSFIVSLPEQEKVTASGRSFVIGEAEGSEGTVRHSAVPWLAGVILLLLLAEWEVYRRGTAGR